MRSLSTPQSALNLEVTKLAIIECGVCVGVYLGIGLYLGTSRYLAVAVVLAPLTLFRTKTSAEWGLRVYKKCLKSFDQRFSQPVGLAYGLLMVMFIPLVGTVIRIVATMYWMARRPLQTLRDTPENWVRQSLCTDFAHPPEIVPLEAVSNDEDIPTFVEALSIFREQTTGWRIVFVFLFVPVLMFGWIPSVIYRISFKATAAAYAPFVWVAHSTLGSLLSVKQRLERITKGEFEKVRRGLSWMILTMLAAKLAFILGWVDANYLESKVPNKKFLTSVVMLDSWPWWQMTLGMDAVLTFSLLFFSDAALARIDAEKPWREEGVLKALSTASFVRAALSIITISHFFWIALGIAAPNLASMLTF